MRLFAYGAVTLALAAGLALGSHDARAKSAYDSAYGFDRTWNAGLRLVRVDPERIGLLLALSIRSVPVVLTMAEQVRDAQRARGLRASPRAYAVPLLIRTLRHADRLGEALIARGADD